MQILHRPAKIIDSFSIISVVQGEKQAAKMIKSRIRITHK